MYWCHSKPSGFLRQANMVVSLSVRNPASETRYLAPRYRADAKLRANHGGDGTPKPPFGQRLIAEPIPAKA
jgi:hypothetical protein